MHRIYVGYVGMTVRGSQPPRGADRIPTHHRKGNQMNYEDLIKSLEECRLRDDSAFAHWIQKYADAEYDTSAWSWENDAYTMAIEAAKLAYEAGRRDTYSPFWQDDGRSFNDGYKHGYEDAAEDPSAWYAKDKNGEHVHIGDSIKNNAGVTTVKGFYFFSDGTPMVAYCPNGYLGSHNIGDCEKVTPATREKVVEDLAKTIKHVNESSYPVTLLRCREIAEKFVNSVEGLNNE